MAGYFPVPRGFDPDLFGDVERQPLCNYGAWCWLFEKAAWQPTAVWVGTRKVELARGELCCAYRYLGRAWGWSHGRVQRFIETLAQRGRIITREVAGQLVVSLLGYDARASLRVDRAPENDQARDAVNDCPDDDNPVRVDSREPDSESGASQIPSQSIRINPPEDSEEPSVCVARATDPEITRDPVALDREFDELWRHYPRQEAEARGRAAYRRVRRLVDRETIAAGIMRCRERYTGRPPDKIPLISTWLDEKRWREADQVELVLPINGGTAEFIDTEPLKEAANGAGPRTYDFGAAGGAPQRGGSFAAAASQRGRPGAGGVVAAIGALRAARGMG